MWHWSQPSPFLVHRLTQLRTTFSLGKNGEIIDLGNRVLLYSNSQSTLRKQTGGTIFVARPPPASFFRSFCCGLFRHTLVISEHNTVLLPNLRSKKKKRGQILAEDPALIAFCEHRRCSVPCGEIQVGSPLPTLMAAAGFRIWGCTSHYAKIDRRGRY